MPGKLWLMPAGAAYQAHLETLRWRHLHSEHGTQPFVDGLRKQIIDQLAPHYVLIDARTGLSDVGGLSTHRLADMVVLVFNLSAPCLEGTVRAYRSITAVTDRSAPQVALVACPVPPVSPSETSPVEARLRESARLMPLGVSGGRRVVRINYDPAMALAETLAVRDPDHFPAAAPRYVELESYLLRSNPSEVFPVVEEARELRAQGRLDEALERVRAFTEMHPETAADGHRALGDLQLEAGRPREAADAYRLAVEREPQMATHRLRLGEALLRAGDAEAAAKALEAAEKGGERGPELYRALTECRGALGDPVGEVAARRKSVLAILGEVPVKRPRPTESVGEARSEFLQVMVRTPPTPGFDAERFWELVAGSLSINDDMKRRIIGSLLDGRVAPAQVSALTTILEKERKTLGQALGPGSDSFQQRIAATPGGVRPPCGSRPTQARPQYGTR